MITGVPVVLKPFPCSFMSRYVCPALVSFLAISATLIVTISILYWNYSETMYVFMITVFNKLAFFIFKPIVFIFTIYNFTGTSELPSPCHLLVNNFIRPRYPGTRYLLVSNLFRPRYRRATKKSTVLDHWGKKVHFLVNLIFWSMNSKHVKEHKL